MLRQGWYIALVKGIQGCFLEEVDVDFRSKRREVDIPGRDATVLWWEGTCDSCMTFGNSAVAFQNVKYRDGRGTWGQGCWLEPYCKQFGLNLKNSGKPLEGFKLVKWFT